MVVSAERSNGLCKYVAQRKTEENNRCSKILMDECGYNGISGGDKYLFFIKKKKKKKKKN